MRLNRRRRDDMRPDQQELYDKVTRNRPPIEDGYIGGPFDAWGLNPTIGRRLHQLGGAIRANPSIDRRYIELAILVTGQLWQAQFEWYAHETMARDAGLPEAVIQGIKAGLEPEFVNEGDRVAWKLCTTLHRDKAIDDTTYSEAVAVFGEEGVADLVHALGFYVLVCMTLNTFEADLPEGVTPPFPHG